MQFDLIQQSVSLHHKPLISLLCPIFPAPVQISSICPLSLCQRTAEKPAKSRFAVLPTRTSPSQQRIFSQLERTSFSQQTQAESSLILPASTPGKFVCRPYTDLQRRPNSLPSTSSVHTHVRTSRPNCLDPGWAHKAKQQQLGLKGKGGDLPQSHHQHTQWGPHCQEEGGGGEERRQLQLVWLGLAAPLLHWSCSQQPPHTTPHHTHTLAWLGLVGSMTNSSTRPCL